VHAAAGPGEGRGQLQVRSLAQRLGPRDALTTSASSSADSPGRRHCGMSRPRMGKCAATGPGSRVAGVAMGAPRCPSARRAAAERHRAMSASRRSCHEPCHDAGSLPARTASIASRPRPAAFGTAALEAEERRGARAWTEGRLALVFVLAGGSPRWPPDRPAPPRSRRRRPTGATWLEVAGVRDSGRRSGGTPGVPGAIRVPGGGGARRWGGCAPTPRRWPLRGSSRAVARRPPPGRVRRCPPRVATAPCAPGRPPRPSRR
jgi:hypothetical protein